MIACCSAALVVLILAIRFGLLLAISPPGDIEYIRSTIFYSYFPQAGFAVMAGWLTLALGGRWKNEAGWIDRMGRALGGCWIAIDAIYISCNLVI
jgi:hypothetical protein